MAEIKCLASGSSGNCYTVDDGSSRLMLDCGISWKQVQRMLDFKTHEIGAALLSHSHGDHAAYVKDAIKAGITVYTSPETIDAIGIASHRIKPVRALEQFKVGGWTVLPFDTVHDVPGSLGFLLVSKGEKVLYLTDTAYCRYRFDGLTHIMCECNYSLDILRENVEAGIVPAELKNRLLKTHMSLETAKGLLNANDLRRVREIHLLHLSNDNSHAERFKREVQQLTGKMVFIAGA